MRKLIVASVASVLGMAGAWIALPGAGNATSSVSADLQSRGETYGAIAASYSGDQPFRSGTASNASSRATAGQRALAACRASGGRNCLLVLEYRGRACGTYYASNDGADYAWGWAMEPRAADANRISLSQCQAQLRAGESCNNVVRVCNTRGGAPEVIQGKSSQDQDNYDISDDY